MFQITSRLLVALLAAAPAVTIAGSSTWVFTVQATAQVQEALPQITLQWLADPYGAESYTIFRKSKEATEWGHPIATLPGSALSFTDPNVSVGNAYEYQLVKQGTLGYKGYGYIHVGLRAPLVEHRGTMLLVVETNATHTLQEELALLRQDLIGDGWQVLRLNVSSNNSPEQVRNAILEKHLSAPNPVDSLFLIGHVPAPMSGSLDFDTHGERPLPADGYYAYLNSDWYLDPATSPSFLPADVQLMLGRVDFFNMPGLGARTPWPSETELLRNYLRKDHLWRHAQLPVPRRALMGNSRGDQDGESVATSGYRAFNPSVGPENVIEANVEYAAPNDERWISHLSRDAFLWAYGCGAGAPDGCGGLGTNIVNGNPGLLLSRDVIENDAKAVFVLLFGSWFPDWTLRDNLMRAFLATRTLGLACASAGRPQWYMHHMALGETIGYSARLSMNNSTLYLNQSNGFPRATFQSLLGDPSLRMEPIPPPSQLVSSVSPEGIKLQWIPSPHRVEGYHVYRAPSPDGPFTRLSPELIAATEFTDFAPAPGTHFYMLRAVALQENPSGTYYNPSQGMFTSATASTQPIRLSASHSAEGIRLSWNSQPGSTYRVQMKENPTDPEWQDISGPLAAQNSSHEWLDTQTTGPTQKLYRVLTP